MSTTTDTGTRTTEVFRVYIKATAGGHLGGDHLRGVERPVRLPRRRHATT